jgi:hypothetical protein
MPKHDNKQLQQWRLVTLRTHEDIVAENVAIVKLGKSSNGASLLSMVC